jgi:hypothetical protein
MTDPRIISIFSAVFAIMGAFSLYTGTRRLADARRAGIRLRWWKQLALLTGIEYILLTFVFLLSLARQTNQVAPSEQGEVNILFLLLLLAAAVVAGMVIRQGLLDMRRNRSRRAAGPSLASSAGAPAAASTVETVAETQASSDLEAQTRRQRERRKNAAAARRRRAGKA